MNFLKRISVLFYVTFMLFLSAFLLLFVLDQIKVQTILDIITVASLDNTFKMAIGVTAVFMFLINYMFYRIFSVNVRREKIIAFDNPSGRVSVSLIAMEDLIKRIITREPEVKEVRPVMSANAKGVNVKIRLVLRSDVNIPEVTSRVQRTVTKKIQDTIGIDEPVDVSIYVGKILMDKFKKRQGMQKSEMEEKAEPTVPFRGYRA